MGDKSIYSQGYIDTIKQLEVIHGAVGTETLLSSIAISLKRIADTLQQANLNGDNLSNAIEGAIYRGLGHRDH